MSRYIDIEQFIRVLEMSNTKIDRSQYANGYNDATITILRSLRAIPTADVVEVRHGEWYTQLVSHPDQINIYSHICKDCGFCYKTTKPEGYTFCPHCGAKMDGERKEG